MTCFISPLKCEGCSHVSCSRRAGANWITDTVPRTGVDVTYEDFTQFKARDSVFFDRMQNFRGCARSFHADAGWTTEMLTDVSAPVWGKCAAVSETVSGTLRALVVNNWLTGSLLAPASTNPPVALQTLGSTGAWTVESFPATCKRNGRDEGFGGAMCGVYAERCSTALLDRSNGETMVIYETFDCGLVVGRRRGAEPWTFRETPASNSLRTLVQSNDVAPSADFAAVESGGTVFVMWRTAEGDLLLGKVDDASGEVASVKTLVERDFHDGSMVADARGIHVAVTHVDDRSLEVIDLDSAGNEVARQTIVGERAYMPAIASDGAGGLAIAFNDPGPRPLPKDFNWPLRVALRSPAGDWTVELVDTFVIK